MDVVNIVLFLGRDTNFGDGFHVFGVHDFDCLCAIVDNYRVGANRGEECFEHRFLCGCGLRFGFMGGVLFRAGHRRVLGGDFRGPVCTSNGRFVPPEHFGASVWFYTCIVGVVVS